ncbi:hypothetical protein PR048_022908 [Dryococelus australis]|uniref:Uncharacterized protein n=1 Tax=Dryococelus australis TaxID=614101 RepID=A0ABQ9GSL1_9NEOP|nr:hypothetical protein PR048_022908 [Dryococelus australis]
MGGSYQRDLESQLGLNEVRMEQSRNVMAGETGDPRENPMTSSIVRPGIEPGSPCWKLGSPLVDDGPIMNPVKYRVVCGVVCTNGTMVNFKTDTNRSGVLAVRPTQMMLLWWRNWQLTSTLSSVPVNLCRPQRVKTSVFSSRAWSWSDAIWTPLTRFQRHFFVPETLRWQTCSGSGCGLSHCLLTFDLAETASHLPCSRRVEQQPMNTQLKLQYAQDWGVIELAKLTSPYTRHNGLLCHLNDNKCDVYLSRRVSEEIWAALNIEDLRADERDRDPRENPPTNGIVRHDSHMRKIRPGTEPGSPWWEASRLTTQPPLDSAVLCTNIPISTAHWLSAATVEGDDWASVLQEVPNTLNALDDSERIADLQGKQVASAIRPARSREPMRVSEVSMEQRRNVRAGETGDPRENPPANSTTLTVFSHDIVLLVLATPDTPNVLWVFNYWLAVGQWSRALTMHQLMCRYRVNRGRQRCCKTDFPRTNMKIRSQRRAARYLSWKGNV